MFSEDVIVKVEREFIAYVKKAIVNKIIDIAEKELLISNNEQSFELTNDVPIIEAQNVFDKTIFDSISRNDLYKVLKELKEDEIELINMIYYQDLSINEISKMTGKTEYSIYSKRNRILNKIKKKLK